MGLVIPEIHADAPDATSGEDAAGPIEAGAVDPDPIGPALTLDADALDAELRQLPRVTLHRAAVPAELDPGRFFTMICGLVLERTPVNFHVEARARRRAAAR